MIQFGCDWCGKLKKATDSWILGLAAETVGVTVTQRQVDILSAWTAGDAVHPLAVHFCSEACKENYTKEVMKSGALAS